MSWGSTYWRTMFPQTVQVTTAGAKASDGSVTSWGSASTYRARIVQIQREVRGANGSVTVANGVAWVASTGRLNTTDRMKVPSGTLPSTTPVILSVEVYTDPDGWHHNKVLLG